MERSSIDNQIPCVVENGIVYGLRDIYRVVRDLGHVQYQEIIEGHVNATGDGYIMSVVANSQSATVVANRRIYLNVNGFDYLKVTTLEEGVVQFDMINSYRTLRLIPIAEPVSEDGTEEKPERFEEYDHFIQEDFAEIQLEDDDDFMDGD